MHARFLSSRSSLVYLRAGVPFARCVLSRLCLDVIWKWSHAHIASRSGSSASRGGGEHAFAAAIKVENREGGSSASPTGRAGCSILQRLAARTIPPLYRASAYHWPEDPSRL